MTMKDLGKLIYPHPSSNTLTKVVSPTFASGIGMAFIVQIPESGQLKKVGICTGTVTTGGNPCGTLRIESLSGNDPSGSLKYNNATGDLVLADTDDNKTVWIPVNGSTGVEVVQGDVVAIRFDWVAGTYTLQKSLSGYHTLEFPYPSTLGSGTWTETQSAPVVALEYDTIGIVTPLGCFPPAYENTQSVNTSTAPYIGNKFSLPLSARIIGAQLPITLAYNASLILYGADEYTPLETVSLDASVRHPDPGLRFVQFSGKYTLLADTVYRLVIVPTSASNITMFTKTFTDDGAIPGIGADVRGINICKTTRSSEPSSGDHAWTDTTTIRMVLGPIFDQIDIPAGSSGPVAIMGMAGGMQ